MIHRVLRFSSFVVFIIFLGCNSFTQDRNKERIQEGSKTREDVKEQDSEFYFLFNNENINYAIILVPDRSEFPIISYYRVEIESVADPQIHGLRSMYSDNWLSLLNNEKTDWAANIVLYYLYQRDAFELSKYENPNKWRKFMKQRDVKYWNAMFNNIQKDDNVTIK